MSQGYIQLHRKIRNHWIYKEKRQFSKFEAWLDLIMSANHKENKFLLGLEILEVKRGEFVTSIRKLGKLWGWSNTKVVNFLDLLQKDNMITVKKDTKRTLISIIKYDFYHSCPDIKKTDKNQENYILKTEKHTNNNKEKDIKIDTYKDTKLTDPPLDGSETNYLSNDIYQEKQKDNLLKESLVNVIPRLLYKTLSTFSDDFDEMYKWFGIILRAKSKVEKERDVILHLELIDERLNQILIKGIRKIKKDTTIEKKDNYLFTTMFSELEKLYIEMHFLENETSQIPKWFEDTP